MTRTITLPRFREIVESYGATPARWPEGEREAAMRLAKSDRRAKDILSCAAALDRALAGLPAPKPADSAFLKRLAAIPYQERPAIGGLRPKTRGWGGISGLFGRRSLVPQGFALAAAGAFGIWLGLHAGIPGHEAIVEIDAGAYFAYNPDLEKDLEEFR